jgi:hypothetical protein
MKHQSNGLVEFHDGKNKKERGFFCMKLVGFINKEAELGTEEYALLWRDRFNMAKAGRCHYRLNCSIYERTKKTPMQLELFTNN